MVWNERQWLIFCDAQRVFCFIILVEVIGLVQSQKIITNYNAEKYHYTIYYDYEDLNT